MKCERADIARARPKIQSQIADEAGGLAFVKTHNALVMDRGFPAINMAVTSGAIYIIRNPLDVAASFAHHIDASLDTAIELMGRKDMETRMNEGAVYEVYGTWSAHVASWTGSGHNAIHIMRYEDMIETPARIFANLAKFLLLEPSDEILQRAIDASSFEKLSAQEDKSGFKEKPQNRSKFFRTGKTGGWRHELSKAQAGKIMKDHEELMRKFDYWPE